MFYYKLRVICKSLLLTMIILSVPVVFIMLTFYSVGLTLGLLFGIPIFMGIFEANGGFNDHPEYIKWKEKHKGE